MSGNKAAKTSDMLRSIKQRSWAEIEEPNGWSYHTSIGALANSAADEIEELELHKERLEKLTVYIDNMSLVDRVKFVVNADYIWEMIYLKMMESFSKVEDYD